MEDRDLILVTMVKKHPHIFDRSSAFFKDKIIVENSWKEIATALKTTADDCQRRWYVLRNRYAKEKREGDTLDPSRKQWALMRHLSFLENHVKRRRSFRAMGMNDLNYRNDDPIPSKSGKWEHIIIDNHQNDISDKFMNSDQSNTSSYYDEEEGVILIKSSSIKNDKNDQTFDNMKSVVSSISNNSYIENNSSDQKNINTNTNDSVAASVTDNHSVACVNDSTMHFCLSLHEPLQKVPKNYLTRAKIEILEILNKYEN